MSDHVIILRTGRLHEYEMACKALQEAGIPYFRQEENSSGVKTAMYSPTMGPGSYWNLLVPSSEKSKAEKIVCELPIDFTTDPDLWHFDSTNKTKKLWKLFIVILLVLTGILCLYKFTVSP